MKKLMIFAVFLLVFGIVGGTYAVPIQVGESSPGWVGTAGGSSSPSDKVNSYDYTLVNEIIAAWNVSYNPAELELLADNSYDYVSGPSMTWLDNYQYLTVKYSTYIDLFYIDGLTSFDWTGSRIGVKNGFSHARLWNPISVPEPATMILLGTALIGLAGLRRRFKK